MPEKLLFIHRGLYLGFNGNLREVKGSERGSEETSVFSLCRESDDSSLELISYVEGSTEARTSLLAEARHIPCLADVTFLVGDASDRKSVV